MFRVRKALAAVAVVIPLTAEATSVGDVEVAIELRDLLEGRDEPRSADAAHVDRFYRDHHGTPAWWKAGEWTPTARTAVEQLRDSDRHGLVPADYEAVELEDVVLEGPDRRDARAVAATDMLLTGAVLRYLEDVANGRVDPRKMGWETHPTRRLDPPTALRNALAGGRFETWIREVGPSRDAYRLLLRAREKHVRLAEGEWPLLPEGPTLDPGDRSERVAIVRRQLMLLGDLSSRPTTAVPSSGQSTFVAYRPGGSDLPLAGDMPRSFDLELQDAVRGFQERHGLTVDGRVGPSTRRALNVSPRQRVDEIDLNLERLRWISDNLGDRYVIVNIPAYELEAYADGSVDRRMKVVVGQPEWQTPILSDRIVNLKFAPDWTIPTSIVREETLPQARSDPGYLRRQSIRIFDGWGAGAREVHPQEVNWSSISARSYVFRQDPGPGNALGRVRFSLTNSRGIYLHDTPAKQYFERPMRALSHGCIRVEDPTGLASFLLAKEPAWDRERISSAMGKTATDYHGLDWSAPVHLVYFTAWVDELGRFHFRDDVYEKNGELARALEAERSKRRSVI